ncbi:protein kinase domain protein [Ichthyophthirius multifiliis]|uniref:Protein kinase domain protein n=1 Tax=Ichthyophthirius multifiliis TaxID=5932 RepID=G0QK58_ICHMU|nr:protein kinase domain protein [Ichthyophthirius multifiliis]EGR34403.1 protein kinase domain protein [Ichthyophthirius multifiliis]|eukprot:XP_004039707.1 protein kinase domain protein [Ichthyophthirius multifiliis]
MEEIQKSLEHENQDLEQFIKNNGVRIKSQTIQICSNIQEDSPQIDLLQKRRFTINRRRSFFTIKLPVNIKQNNIPSNQSFYQKYKIHKKLGDGSNSIVKLCSLVDKTALESRKYFAVKVFKMETINETLEIQREAQLLQKMNHINIIRFKELIYENNNKKAYLVLEYIQGSTLQQYIEKHQKITESEAFFIIRQVFEALSYLEQCEVTHNDIKPDNIMYNPETGRVTLIDFSTSRKIVKQNNLQTNLGTLNYKAPERLNNQHSNPKSDIWSTGIVLFYLLIGQLPFQDDLKGKIQQLEQISKQVNEELQQHIKELASLNNEKDQLGQVLNMKAQDVEKTLMNELIRLEDEMNRHITNQSSENLKIQSRISIIRADKVVLEETLANLTQRITDLEINVGIVAEK